MKLFCLFFIAFAVAVNASTDEKKTNLKKWSDECQAETGVSQEAIEKVKVRDYSGIDAKFKSYGLCVAKKTGIINAAGELNVEGIRSKLKKVVDTDEDLEKIMTKCVVTKSTPEETAFQTIKCLRENQSKFSIA